MAINFAGSSSGSTILQANSAAGGTITLNNVDARAGGWVTHDANRYLGGVNSYTWSGIPTSAREIQLCFYRVSMNTNTNGGRYNIRVGNGGINTSSIYAWFSTYNASSKQENNGDNKWRLTHTDHTGASHIETGVMQMQRVSGGYWHMTAWFYDLTNLHWRANGVWRSNTSITHLQWYAPANSFNEAAQFSVLYR